MKVFKVFLVIVLVAVVAFFVIFFGVIRNVCKKQNANEQENREQIYEGGSQNALVLYQESQTNMVTDSVDKIKETLLESGYTVTQNHPRADLTYDLDEYDIVVFVSPIYAISFAQPMTSYIEGHNFEDRKVFVLLTGMIGDNGECKKVEELFPDSTKLVVAKAKGANDEVLTKLSELLKD